MTHIDVRPMRPDETRASSNATSTALLMSPVDDTTWEAVRASWEQGYHGSSAWDGAQCVGHVGAIDFDMLLPGGRWVPTAGVTRVGVVPTHTRRGLLTRMMQQVLAEQRAKGAALAALLASETPIYGRFGFGHATDEHDLRIDTTRVGGIHGAAPGSFRLVPGEQAIATAADIYERTAHRPGTISRPTWLMTRYLAHLTDPSKAEHATHLVVHTSPDGTDDGYARYSVHWNEERGVERLGSCEVAEIVAASPAVELALWSYLCSISLIRDIRFERAPTEALIRAAAHDTRAVSVNGEWDELFLRPLDVDACLTGRSYGDARGSVALAVADPMFPDNNGTWAISAEGAHRTTAPADITATVNALGSTLLGGFSWARQAAVGAASGSADAIARADALFHTEPAPFCGSFF
ncbi:MAG: Enhanced intracellular survival protein [Actinomycetota bacterium]